MANQRICLIGFGDVGQVLVRDFAQRGLRELSVWAVLFKDPLRLPAVALAAGRRKCAVACSSKGWRPLFTGALLAARHYRVEQIVLESLNDMFPGTDTRELGRYMISRSLFHGRRCAEEMREVARKVRDAGLNPHMSLATAARRDSPAQYPHAEKLASIESLLDRLRAKSALC